MRSQRLKPWKKFVNSDLLEIVKYQSWYFYHENEKHHIEAYHEALHNGMVEVKYNKKKGMNFGRVYAKRILGAINFRREIRGTVFQRIIRILKLSIAILIFIIRSPKY